MYNQGFTKVKQFTIFNIVKAKNVPMMIFAKQFYIPL